MLKAGTKKEDLGNEKMGSRDKPIKSCFGKINQDVHFLTHQARQVGMHEKSPATLQQHTAHFSIPWGVGESGRTYIFLYIFVYYIMYMHM
jgi:hypothetical protein